MDRQHRRDWFGRILRTVCQQPGKLSTKLRTLAASGGSLPPQLQPLAVKIRRHAWLVGDADIAAAKQAGYSDDQLFELTVATALGASRQRLEIIIRALARLE